MKATITDPTSTGDQRVAYFQGRAVEEWGCPYVSGSMRLAWRRGWADQSKHNPRWESHYTNTSRASQLPAPKPAVSECIGVLFRMGGGVYAPANFAGGGSLLWISPLRGDGLTSYSRFSRAVMESAARHRLVLAWDDGDCQDTLYIITAEGAAYIDEDEPPPLLAIHGGRIQAQAGVEFIKQWQAYLQHRVKVVEPAQ